MTKTLVTGANGFVAVHVVDQLLKAGHEVTGTIRKPIYGEQLLSFHPEWKDKITFFTVPDIASPGAYDEVFESVDFDHVAHVAAPMPLPHNTDFDRDFLEPMLKGNLELLESAGKYGKNLKSIVVTGTINAITYGNAEHITGKILTSEDWLPTTIEEARAANNYFVSYSTAKKLSEQAIWHWIGDNLPEFAVTVLLPALIFGPPIHYVEDAKAINYSTDIIASFFNGTRPDTPPTSFPSYIDVRDLVKVHIQALTTPKAGNKRFLVGGDRWTAKLTADLLRKIPEIAPRVVPDGPAENPPVLQIDTTETERLFGKEGWHSADETFGDTVHRILELEKQTASK